MTCDHLDAETWRKSFDINLKSWKTPQQMRPRQAQSDRDACYCGGSIPTFIWGIYNGNNALLVLVKLQLAIVAFSSFDQFQVFWCNSCETTPALIAAARSLSHNIKSPNRFGRSTGDTDHHIDCNPRTNTLHFCALGKGDLDPREKVVLMGLRCHQLSKVLTAADNSAIGRSTTTLQHLQSEGQIDLRHKLTADVCTLSDVRF